MKRIASFGAVAVLSLLAVAPASAATLLVNGNFDTPDISDAFITYNSPPAGFGWSIVSDNTPFFAATTGFNGVDLVGQGGYGTTANPDGLNQFVDIDGVSILHQDFATTVGQRYSLSFAYSHNPLAASESIRVLVSGGGTLLDQTVTHNLANSLADPNWRIFSTTFIAAAALTTLSFNGLDTGSAFDRAQGFFLDDVSVSVAPVPLPATAGLLVAALGGFVVFRRKRVCA
jgi:hypothetical protein